MYRTERIFITTALLVVGLALIVAINRGALGAGSGGLGTLVWLMALSMIAIAGLGAVWVRGSRTPSEPAIGSNLIQVRMPFLRLPLDVIIPTMLAAGAVVFVQIFDSAAVQVVVMLVAGAAFAGVFWAQLHAHDTRDRYFSLAHSALNVAAHLTAFSIFSVIYGAKLRSLFSASAVGFVTALLLFELLSRDAAWHRALGLPVEGRRATLGLLALGGGLLTAELTWGLNQWAALSTLIGGAFLLVVFYVLHGLASHYVDRNLTRQMLFEYGVVGAAGMLAVFASAFFA